MGLAEPRKRQKLSHDPRNLAWSSQSSATSYGHRLMTQQGWSQGQALGKRTTTSRYGAPSDAERLAAAHVGVLFKDDNLGLGARRKSGKEAVENQKVGLDAFQGLLGRLNGKSEEVLKQEEKKVEDRKLEMYARGRWGGMIFVRGGVLVGTIEENGRVKDNAENSPLEDDQTPSESESASQAQGEARSKEREERRRMKEEKRQRKEERRKRREEKVSRRAAKKAKDDAQALPAHKSPLTQPPDEPVSSAASDDEAMKPKGQTSESTSHQRIMWTPREGTRRCRR
ncbi:G-patch domain-containing protein [Cladophialophora immunda]|nr:G-patch domain-containing protein [Cladophialophora immunda]